MAVMLRRTTKFGIAIAAGAITLSGAYAFANNGWPETSSIGIVRFGRAAFTVSRVALDYKLSLRGIDPSSPEYEAKKSEVHTRSANRLLDLCCANGGVFIKVGQHIGALDYLVPHEYVSTLKVLHNRAPQSSTKELLKVLQEDLGKPPEDLFVSFSKEPLGTASLAQVHEATLKDGRVVALKIQHPKVKSHSATDMKTMDFLVNVVAWLFPDFSFMWLAEETKRNLPKELDFVNEGHNAEKVGKMFSHFPWLKVPKVYWDISSPRVLAMEFCEGGLVNDKKYMEDHNISMTEVSKKLGQLYSEMIFEKGYVHCDPHPGNILVQKEPEGIQIILLDHGLYTVLSDDFRVKYSNMWLALLKGDVKGMEYWGKVLGVGDGDMYKLLACMMTARSWSAVEKGIVKHRQTKEENEALRDYAATLFPVISTVLGRVPREMLLMFKTNDLLRGIETSLGTFGSAYSFALMTRGCVRAIYRKNLESCRSWACRMKLYVTHCCTEAMFFFYPVYLWCKRFLKRFHGLEDEAYGL